VPTPPDRASERAFIETRSRVVKLDDAEIAAHLDLALSPAHWAALAPDLDAGCSSGSLETRGLDADERDAALRLLAAEGWLRTEPFLAPDLIAAMRRAILRVVAAGWHPVFAYVYDELWQILRAPSVRAIAAAALGPGYHQSPRVWAFCVRAEKGAAGWPPHVDGGAGTHTADRITLWIPLGDATLENGCMYLVPKDLVPARTADDFASDMSAIDAHTWRAMLQGARAMPARAGSLLAWDFQVVHWSSFAGAPDAPRVSLAVECLGEQVTPTPSELPLLDPEAIPPFAERLRAIARGIVSYERFEPATLRYVGLARAILERLDRLDPPDLP
jgi:hypothetical protein